MTELPRARPVSADCPASVEVGGRSPLPWEQTDGALKSVLARPRCTSLPVPLPAPLRPPHGSQVSPVYTRAAASCQGSPCCAGQDRWLPAQGSEEVTGGGLSSAPVAPTLPVPTVPSVIGICPARARVVLTLSLSFHIGGS